MAHNGAGEARAGSSMTDKLIVTHGGALRRKYGAAGYREIRAAIRRLIAADRRRGLAAKLVLLDDARAMRVRRGSCPKVSRSYQRKLMPFASVGRSPPARRAA